MPHGWREIALRISRAGGLIVFYPMLQRVTRKGAMLGRGKFVRGHFLAGRLQDEEFLAERGYFFDIVGNLE